MKKEIKLPMPLFLFVLAAFFALCIGWVLNIWQIAEADSITGMLILRVIGIFAAPFGGIIGWI